MRFDLRRAVPAVALLIAPACAAATPERYNGLCEASAAAIIDTGHFVVASDDSDTLQVYRRGQPSPVAQHRHAGVTDIEAATRIGDTIVWLTSHSVNSGGEDKPKRKQVFATRITAPALLADTDAPVVTFRDTVAQLLKTDAQTLMPVLNIEGLAATDEGRLLVGLRAPLGAGDTAQILELDNPVGAAGSGAPGIVHTLPLGKRGIRSIERVGSGPRAYLILAGGATDADDRPALFWWDGKTGVTPQDASLFDDAAPEALIAWSETDIQILGDNGGCSDKPASVGPRSFPSLTLDLRP